MFQDLQTLILASVYSSQVQFSGCLPCDVSFKFMQMLYHAILPSSIFPTPTPPHPSLSDLDICSLWNLCFVILLQWYEDKEIQSRKTTRKLYTFLKMSIQISSSGIFQSSPAPKWPGPRGFDLAGPDRSPSILARSGNGVEQSSVDFKLL